MIGALLVNEDRVFECQAVVAIVPNQSPFFARLYAITKNVEIKDRRCVHSIPNFLPVHFGDVLL